MRQLTNMMEQVKKLKNGLSIQSLMDTAHEIMGNPIVMFNTEYNLLAHTDATTDDPIWNDLVTTGTFSNEMKRFFVNEGFVEEIANTSKIVLLKSKKLKYDRIIGKIFNKNNAYIANLAIIACNKPFEKNDLLVFEVICKLITKEVSKNELFREYEQTHQEIIIKNLIDGNYDVRLDIAQVGILYDSLDSGLYIAVVDISQCGLEQTDIAYFRDLLKQTAPRYKYAIYSNYIVIIVSTNDDNLNLGKDLRELIKVFEQNNLYAGISNRFENLFDLKKNYMKALKAMNYTLECKCSQRIFPYNPKSLDIIEKICGLTNGIGIQYFLNIGPEIFGNPLLFHDMELNLLAYTENVEIIDPIWEELITYGTSSDETINLFKTEGFVNTMENTKGGAILISDKIKYDRISWRIYSKDNIMIGCLSIVNSDKPFSEDELILFGMFSQKFSKEVGEIEFYNNYGQVYSETVINRLINGKIDDYTFYSDDIGNLYDDLMENLYLAVIDTSQSGFEHVKIAYYRDLFNWPNTVNRYALHSNYIIIIISADNTPIDKKNELKEVGKAFEKANIYAGISSRFENIYELRKYYTEAVSALNCGIKNNDLSSKQRIFLYEKR